MSHMAPNNGAGAARVEQFAARRIDVPRRLSAKSSSARNTNPSKGQPQLGPSRTAVVRTE